MELKSVHSPQYKAELLSCEIRTSKLFSKP
jgi:hypothetical protein